jgi:UDPglucose 6-dehydrogenase
MSDIRVGVVGAGYVGLTTAVCLAARGVNTVCVDVDVAKVNRLREGDAVIDEPGLAECLRDGLAAAVLTFHSDYAALSDCNVVYVCVSTPSRPDGGADLSALESAVNRLRSLLRPRSVVVLKSTAPVGTARRMAERLHGAGVGVVSNPEFLREGHAVQDCQHPDRIIIGSQTAADAAVVEALHGGESGLIQRMSLESAELAKYASNAFLAVKLSYTNSLARLCAKVGADIGDVTRCMGADARIGGHFLVPGPGWGGSCLPKDTAALVRTARDRGVKLLEVESARATNEAQAQHILEALRQSLPDGLASPRVGVLGLTFKAGISDVRDSPALNVCALLDRVGVHVSGYDPRLRAIDPVTLRASAVVGVDDPYLATKEADAILVLTEWPEFRELDWRRIAGQAPRASVIDTRNMLDPSMIRDAGLGYVGNGLPAGY